MRIGFFPPFIDANTNIWTFCLIFWFLSGMTERKTAKAFMFLILKSEQLLGNIQNQLKVKEDWKYGEKILECILKQSRCLLIVIVTIGREKKNQATIDISHYFLK